MSNTVKLVISIAATVGIGLLGGIFTGPEIQTWFVHLQKPSWNPPNWLFAPVWSTLYLLMGIAFYLIWKSPGAGDGKRWAMIIFIVQFALNFFWSFIFFREHQMGWAFVEIIVLWIAILCTIIAFSRINKTAAWLLVPYISWVSFAAILNYTIWQLNA
ncbi:MAG TPA: TspO/MBR family protein [Chitinophagaceae bacterium]|nr:TspO/MBR family protein [Chitinophagaceae bacterium]